MIAFVKRVFLIAAALALSVPAFAVAPGGTIVKVFNTENTPIWDFTGGYQLSQQIIGAGGEPIDVTFGITIVVDDRGNVSGSGVTFAYLGPNFDVVGGSCTVS